MRAKLKSLAAIILGSMLLSSAIAEGGVTIAYQEPLQQLQLGRAASLDQQKLSNSVASSMSFEAFGRRFDIRLEENRSLLSRPLQQRFDNGLNSLPDNSVDIYRGDIAGMSGSWVRLVIADELPRGMLWDGVELWAIDIDQDPATGASTPYMYRLSDLLIPPGTLACSDVGVAKNAGELAKAVFSDIRTNVAQGPGASQQIDIAVIADFEFTSNKGANTDAEIITRMNNIDGIFSMQLGVQLNVSRIDSFAANNDPFTDVLDSGLLLDELSDYRDSTPAQNSSGLSHLFTGRDLDTTTVGIAYTGALCSRRFGTGLTQGTHTVTTDTLIAAHELGHNFGAPHDGTSGSACESETGDFLMATRINGSDEFSSCSIAEMQDDVNRASCITALPTTDIALLGGGQPGIVLLGDAATVTFDANSVGTDTASSVAVDISIPAGVTLQSVSATSGSCTTGAGTASCAIGAVVGGSGATVTLVAATSAVGTADFVASVTAATDANSNNNQATVRVTVDPAVDLVATAAAAAQVALDGSTTLRPNVENRSSIAATGISVTVTPGAGISIDTADWAAGNCDIANNVATCQASSLAAQSNTQLQIGVTGTSAGSRSYTVNASAAETDRNTSNNNASGQLTVNSPTTGSSAGDDSGGGSMGWLFMLALLLVRRQTAAPRRHA
ncbi:MAG: M12 family metallo-peptidase [Woeseiaceae bacterium]